MNNWLQNAGGSHHEKTTTYNGSDFSDDLNFLKFGILMFDRLYKNTLAVPENTVIIYYYSLITMGVNI